MFEENTSCSLMFQNSEDVKERNTPTTIYTLEINMEPENHLFEKENPSSKPPFLGSMLLFRGVPISICKTKLSWVGPVGWIFLFFCIASIFGKVPTHGYVDLKYLDIFGPIQGVLDLIQCALFWGKPWYGVGPACQIRAQMIPKHHKGNVYLDTW